MVVNKHVNRACIGCILAIITIQPPRIDCNSCCHLFRIKQYVIDWTDAPEYSGRVVFKSIHHHICPRSDTLCRWISCPVSNNGYCDVSSVTGIGIVRRRVKSKLSVSGCDPSCQIRVILIQPSVRDCNHFTRTIKSESSIVVNILNTSNRPSEGVVNTKFSRGFGPDDSAIVSNVSKER